MSKCLQRYEERERIYVVIGLITCIFDAKTQYIIPEHRHQSPDLVHGGLATLITTDSTLDRSMASP